MNIRIASLVKDEADRMLPQLLPIWRELGEVWVQIDGGTKDVQAHIDLLEEHDCRYTFFDGTMEGHEWSARKHLWDWVTCTGEPEWIVHLDADHMPAGDFRPYLKFNRVAFHVFDMWSATHYREDEWWRVAPWWGAVNVKNFRDYDWYWSTRGWHSGHLPLNIGAAGPEAVMPLDVSVLHYGYATPRLREQHHAAYMARHKVLTPQELAHAQTIVDEEPRIRPLPFEPKWELDMEGF